MSHYCSAIVPCSVMRSKEDRIAICHELGTPLNQHIPLKNRSKTNICLTKRARLDGKKTNVALVQKDLNPVSDHHEINWPLWNWQKVCNGKIVVLFLNLSSDHTAHHRAPIDLHPLHPRKHERSWINQTKSHSRLRIFTIHYSKFLLITHHSQSMKTK